ncbi:hypothetical protein QBE52_16070 [Clostridiaceae bacterium 35-E11]
MKKIFIAVMIGAMLLSGCATSDEKKTGANPNENKEGMSTVDASDKIMTEYDDLLKQDVKPAEVVHFVDNSIEKVSIEAADEMIRGLEAFQKPYEEKYMNAFFEEGMEERLIQALGYAFEKSALNEVKDEEVKALLTEVLDGGYKLVNLEGMYYPMMDYSIYKKYAGYLSEAMKDYIDLMAMESDKLMARDAGLSISWDELAERALKVEAFLVTYPNTPMEKTVVQRYKSYLGTYMTGLDNTPIFDWNAYIQSNIYKVSEEILDKYHKTIDANKNTITAKTMEKYIELLEKNDFQLPYEKESELQKFNDARYGLLEKAIQDLSAE